MLKRSFFLLMLVLLFALPGVAYAQQPVVIDTLEVDLWPEYDRPEMLVIYRISLDAAVSLPTSLTISIPADAELNAVAEEGATGELVNADFETQEAGDRIAVNVTANSSYVQLEYYDPSLQKDGTARHYEYSWDDGYAIKQLIVEVQQPLGASDMQAIPPMGAGQLREDTLTYYHVEIGSLDAGQSFEFSLDYNKSSDTLTVSQFQSSVPAATDESVEASVPFDWVEALPWVGLVIGLGIMAFGAYRFWQSSREEDMARQRKSTKRGRRSGSGSGGKSIFCHECGTKSQFGDRFCRNCGEKLRV
jgi:hypothetical protein